MYKSGTIPQERVDMLNEVGFRLEWIHQDQKWDMRYAELQEFKKEFGHWIVPQNYERNKKLGTWVIHQRRQLKSRQLRHDRFQKVCMTPTRIINCLIDFHAAYFLSSICQA